MSFLGEIKRRKVFQVAAVYAVVAWLIVQVVGEVKDPLNLPDSLDTVIIVLLAVGFPIAVILAWAFEVTPDGVVRDHGSAMPDRRSGRRMEYVLVGLLFVAVAWIAYRELSPPSPAVLANSVAVLPFENLSADENNAFFAAGIHEAILNELTNIADLNVIARTSVLRYENTDLSIKEIARELRVETVMEGSVQYADGRVLVTAQLIDPDTEAHLWSGNYDRDLSDVFEIQADIARRIATRLEAELTDSELARIEDAPTASGEAYTLYLRALALWQSANPGLSGTPIEPIIALLDRAIAIDEDFALAYALKSRAYASRAGYFCAPNTLNEEWSLLARENLGAALSLAPNLGLAHATRAEMAANDLELDQAREAAERALALSPNDIAVLNTVGNLYTALGEHDKALSLLGRAVELDPNSSGSINDYGNAFAWAGRPAEALVWNREAGRVDPGNVFVPFDTAKQLTALHDYEDVPNVLRETEALFREGCTVASGILAEIAYMYARAGDLSATQRILADLSHRELMPSVRVFVFLAMGDADSALAELKDTQTLATPSDPALRYLVTNYYRDPILEQVEFVRERERLVLR